MKKISLLVVVSAMAIVGAARATVLPAPTVYNATAPFNGSYLAANATDGSYLEYATSGAGTSTFLEMNFGSLQTFDKVIPVNRNGGSGDMFLQVTYTFSTDATFGGGDPTATITTDGLPGRGAVYSIGGPVTAQYVRFDVDTLAGPDFLNTGAQELLFVQTPTGTAPVMGVTVINSATPYPNALYAASHAADGFIGYTTQGTGIEYASSNQGANTFVDFDFGLSLPIAGFDFFDRLPEKVAAFDLLFSNDPTFTSGVITQSYSKGSVLTQSATFSPISARYVRYDVTSGTGNLGLSELIFYQAIPEPSTFALVGLALVPLFLRRRR